jgi:hypothetical protein
MLRNAGSAGSAFIHRKLLLNPLQLFHQVFDALLQVFLASFGADKGLARLGKLLRLHNTGEGGLKYNHENIHFRLSELAAP